MITQVNFDNVTVCFDGDETVILTDGAGEVFISSRVLIKIVELLPASRSALFEDGGDTPPPAISPSPQSPKRPKRPRRSFDDDFKAKAVRLALGIPMARAARQLDVSKSVLKRWVDQRTARVAMQGRVER